MNTLPESTFEPSFPTTGKLAFGSATTVDTTEFLSFDFSDDEGEDVLEISNRCDLNSSNRYNGNSFAIKKATPENCDGVKTRISPSRTKSGGTRRKPKGGGGPRRISRDATA